MVLDPTDDAERARFTFPRQRRDRFLCLADFFRPKESGELDVVALPPGDDGRRVAEVTGELFAKNATATTSSCTGCRCS